MEEFEGLVPETVEFEIGYFSGKQSKKQWLIGDEDIVQMYETLKKPNILLWCDRKQPVRTDNNECHSSQVDNRKRPSSQVDPPKSKRFELESEVDDIVMQLQEIHSDKFTIPQLRMWARYVQAGHYKDLKEPPPLPAFNGGIPKRARKESLSDALAGAAVTIIDAIRSPHANANVNTTTNLGVVINTPPKNEPAKLVSVGVSPGRAAELRMRKLKELRELHSMLGEGILNDSEFVEQKTIVLESLRKLQ